MTEVWPSILVPSQVEFHLVPFQGYGPRSSFGVQQVISSDRGYWRATLSRFNLRTPDQIREWRATIASLSGSAGQLLIGPFDCKTGPRSLPDEPQTLSGIPFSDQSLFSDGAGFSQSSSSGVTSSQVLLRSTLMNVTLSSSGQLRRGMYFSVSDRLYIITAISVSGSSAIIRFAPPMRRDTPAGTAVEFSRPRCLMRLSDEMSGVLSLSMGRFADPTLELEESPIGL